MITVRVENKFAFIDDEDLELFKCFVWRISSNGYLRNTDGKMFHRIVMKAQKGQMIDHKDRNPSNNCKSNLRFCTHAQNQMNKKATGKSKYLGVSPHIIKNKYRRKTDNKLSIYVITKWRSQISVNGKQVVLGRFNDEITAAIAYDQAAKKYHKEFANLNFKENG